MRKLVNKKVTAKKPIMKRGGTKKPLRKAQTGTTVMTPFQEYLTIPGTQASDTLFSSKSMEKTETHPTLNKAYELTYGQDYKQQLGNYWGKPYENMPKYRGSHRGYSDPNNPYRKSFSAEVAAKKAAASAAKKTPAKAPAKPVAKNPVPAKPAPKPVRKNGGSIKAKKK
jgi:hypothetical protein